MIAPNFDLIPNINENMNLELFSKYFIYIIYNHIIYKSKLIIIQKLTHNVSPKSHINLSIEKQSP